MARGAFRVFLALVTFSMSLGAAEGFTEHCPTYYVNLRKSTDRRARMERLFDSFTNLHRVPGVDGHNKREVLDVLRSMPLSPTH
jgi:hypothetical protein